jgi:hypothetical protein
LHAIDHSHLRFVRNKPAHLAVQHDVIAERALAAAGYALGGQMALGVTDALAQPIALAEIDGASSRARGIRVALIVVAGVVRGPITRSRFAGEHEDTGSSEARSS